MKSYVIFKKLPDIWKRITALEKRMGEWFFGK
jgi:hypothetical protein